MRKMKFNVQALTICCIIVLMPAGSESQNSEPVWMEWTDWILCNRACGGGRSFRVRECSDQTGTSDCEQSESRPCNTQPCDEMSSPSPEPASVGWREWTEWTICTVSCGGGKSFRVRECDNPDGDSSCENSQSRACNSAPCDVTTPVAETAPVTGLAITRFGAWGTWSSCDKLCEGGFRYRMRECLDLTGGLECEQTEQEMCNTNACEVTTPVDETPPVTGIAITRFGAWGTWSLCDKLCEGGFRYRTRECLDLTGGLECEQTEQEMCNTNACEVPTPTPEGMPESPAVTAEPRGSPERAAETSTPEWMGPSTPIPESNSTPEGPTPTPEGESGPTSTSEPTGTPEGATSPEMISSPSSTPEKSNVGDYTEWGEWSECDKQCGGGFRYRTRTCVNMTSGSECEQVEESACNIEPCTAPEPAPEGMPDQKPEPETSAPTGSPEPEITSTEWMPVPESTAPTAESTQSQSSVTVIALPVWSEWGDCTKPCGGGLTYRYRDCYGSDKNCTEEDRRSCNTYPCAPEPEITSTKWMPEPEGTASAGSPEPEVTSEGTPEPEVTSSGMMPEPETTNSMATYTEWGEWSECDKLCEGGFRYRTRTCVIMTSESECEQVEKSACNIEPCTGPTPTPEGEPEPTPTPEDMPGVTEPEKYTSTEKWRPEPELRMSTGVSTKTPVPEIKWPEWGDWSDCTESCGGGLTFRYRECYGWKGDCTESDTRSCNTQSCSPKFRVMSTEKPKKTSCGKRNLLAEVGYYKSLSFHTKHDRSFTCVWSILAPEDHRIKMVVEEFKMVEDTDVLEIFEGTPSTTSGKLGVRIAMLTTEVDDETSFYTITRRMSVRIQTTKNGGKSSFRLRYKAIRDADMMENEDEDYDKHSNVELWWKLLRYLRKFMSQVTKNLTL